MPSAEQRLWNLVERAASEERIHEADVSRIFTSIYKIIESNDWKPCYRYIILYRNLMQHSNLSHKQNLKFLLNFGKILNHDIHGIDDPQRLKEAIARQLGVSQLRRELILLFSVLRLPTFLFDNADNWKRFFTVVLTEIEGTTIEFPFDEWWGKTKSRATKELKPEFQKLSPAQPLRFEVFKKEEKNNNQYFVSLTCDWDGFVTDPSHYIILDVEIP